MIDNLTYVEILINSWKAPEFYEQSINLMRIHWFSIFNSFMMVLFLVALVCMILMRTLRRDYARYNKEDGLSDLVSLPVLLCLV
ncbi:unnamed protein product [Schistosoma margrebowiei]|uniref:Transmembrane 9 superfamily member n=2 Tax=Schistosoma TaxID=6181 RepID=A0A3P7XTI9_9TREM|nr:unnamed protein product [Schistosoma margrebowiei]